MKNLTKTFNTFMLIVGILFTSTGSLQAQYYDIYDTGSSYPAYDTGTTYPIYDTGTTYPIYDTGTTYPTYNTGTTYPIYDTGTTYPIYDTGTTYPTYDTGTTYPIYNTGTTYPTYNTGTTYPTYDTGTTYPIYNTGTTYPTYNTGSANYGYTNYGSTDYGYTTPPSFSGYNYGPGYTYPTQPVYTPAPVYTQPPVYTSPVYTPAPTYPIIPVTPVAVCSDGSSPINGTCVRTNTIPVVNNFICADGQAPINGTCVRTNTIPVINNIICSDGSYPVNGSCVRTITAPVITYQTCWDGSVIPLSSVCSAQYKTCPNGTNVPVNQTCYYAPTPAPYTPPVTIKFNNVITSVATEITLSSARCNGIGLIASNAPSMGWFEYGETANLGRETAKASIGSSITAPFSNMLANLKPTTTYYCRAIMQNQYGTVKGEIVAFTTKTKAVTYVKPVTKTTTQKTVATKTVSNKTQITCIDGTTVSTGSKSSADIINNGQKLMSLQIEKVSGNLVPGSAVNYKLSFKNLSNETLSRVTLKVTVPSEITITQASLGNYDPVTHTLTATIQSLSAQAEGSIGLTGTVASSSIVGKPVAMTGYANYTVPGTNVQDEVTAYTVGLIVPAAAGSADTGAKKVIGAPTDFGFLPNSLVEWLALIAIIFIIFILARSVYTSYREEKVIVQK